MWVLPFKEIWTTKKKFKVTENGEDLVTALEEDPSIWELLSATQQNIAMDFKKQKMEEERLVRSQESRTLCYVDPQSIGTCEDVKKTYWNLISF